MRPQLHFEPDKIAAQAVRKALVRLLLAYFTAHNRPLLYFDLKLVYIAESHATQDIYFHPMPYWTGTYEYPHRRISRLTLNFYGYRSAAHTNYIRLDTHLAMHQFKASHADSCL